MTDVIWDIGETEKMKVVFCDYDEINEVIKAEFPNNHHYEILAEEELGNDSSWVCKADGESYDEERVSQFEEGIGTIRATCHLLNYLASKGTIEKAVYVVKVCW